MSVQEPLAKMVNTINLSVPLSAVAQVGVREQHCSAKSPWGLVNVIT